MYCIDCGKFLPGEYNHCGDCKTEIDKNKIHCPECGSGNNRKSPHCADCGARLHFPPELIKTAPRPDTRSRKKAAVLAFTLGFAGANEYYLGFHKKGARQAIWFVVSIVVAFLIWLLLVNQMDKAFTVIDGQKLMMEEYAQGQLGWWIAIAVFIVIALGSALVAWIRAIAEGIYILKNKGYKDADGQFLE